MNSGTSEPEYDRPLTHTGSGNRHSTFSHAGGCSDSQLGVFQQAVQRRAQCIHQSRLNEIEHRAVGMIMCLLAMQWVASVAALVLATLFWQGPIGHNAFWLSVGGSVVSVAPLFAWTRGVSWTSLAAAVSQLLWSTMLIHWVGRPETYLHLIGSMIMLAGFQNRALLLIAATVPAIYVAACPLLGVSPLPLQVLGVGSVEPVLLWTLFVALFFNQLTKMDEAALLSAENLAKLEMSSETSRRSLQLREEEASRHASLLQVMLEAASGAACAVDQHGRVLNENEAWRREWGRESARLLEPGLGVDSPWGPHAEPIAAELRRVLIGESAGHSAKYVDGDRVFAVRILAVAGEKSRAAVVSQLELGDRVAIERALATTTRELTVLRTVVECTRDAVCVLDARGRLVRANARFEELTGYSEQELLGQLLHRYVASPDTTEEALAAVDDCLQLQCGCDVDIPCRDKDGQRFDASLLVRPVLDDQDELLQFVAVYRDTTSQRQRQEEQTRLHAQFLEAARRAALGACSQQSLKMVADNLTDVGIMSGLVMNRLKASSVPRLVRAGALIEANADRLQEFIESDPQGTHLPAYLSTFASRLSQENNAVINEMRQLQTAVADARALVSEQLEQAKVPPIVEAVSLNDVIEESLLALTPHLVDDKAAGPEFERHLDALPPLQLDRRKLLQIVLNLLSNAKQAVRDTSEPRIVIRSFIAASKAVLEVSDNGCGISLENLPRLFRRGFSTWHGGRGYGLYCGQQAVTELGGCLAAQSNGQSAGATFRLELPLPLDFALGGLPASRFGHDAEDSAAREQTPQRDDEWGGLHELLESASRAAGSTPEAESPLPDPVSASEPMDAVAELGGAFSNGVSNDALPDAASAPSRASLCESPAWEFREEPSSLA
ncbi:MAG: PAS domain S-box protein [Planctomycetales bacterium]|nr:PAS domain S-box protein [Planctomycetales bacterium]